MEVNKLQDLINAANVLMDPKESMQANPKHLMLLFPKLLEALKETAAEVKCPNCGGRGYLTGSTAFEGCTRGKCPQCKGTGNKYPFLLVSC